jgi:hypothetical protein
VVESAYYPPVGSVAAAHQLHSGRKKIQTLFRPAKADEEGREVTTMQGYNDFLVYGQYRMEEERRRVAGERLEAAICCYIGTGASIRASFGRLFGGRQGGKVG